MAAAGMGQCVAMAWQPQIGDPELTGWLTMLAYLLCVVLAAQAWGGLRGQPGRAFWAMITILMLFLALNKQLDLQTGLTALGRCIAQAQGWYEGRRAVQLGFIALLVIIMLIGLRIGFRYLRGDLRRHGLALIGLMLLCAYVALRAIGFHLVDALIRQGSAGISVNYIVENAGIFMIALNAWMIRKPG